MSMQRALVAENIFETKKVNYWHHQKDESAQKQAANSEAAFAR